MLVIFTLLVCLMVWVQIPRVKADIISVTFQVGDGFDDAHETGNGTLDVNGTQVHIASRLNWYGNFYYRCGGFRFQNVTIPRTAKIVWANFSGYVFGNADDMFADVYGDLVTDSLNFVDNPYVFSNETARPHTVATVSWAEFFPFDPSPEARWLEKDGFENIVQELVNYENWMEGDALTLLFIGKKADPSNGCYFYSYEQASEYGAKLEVGYLMEESDVPAGSEDGIKKKPWAVPKIEIPQIKIPAYGYWLMAIAFGTIAVGAVIKGTQPRTRKARGVARGTSTRKPRNMKKKRDHKGRYV